MSTLLVYKIPDFNNKAEIRTSIAQIDAIINELLTSAMKAASTGNYTEYEFDSGQTKVKAKYTSVASVAQGIKDFRDLRQMLVNQLNGSNRVVQLMDSRNFNRRC